MKMWMWKAVLLVTLAGFPALAETPAGSHAGAPASPPISKPSTIAPQPSNPAENKTGRITEFNDACRLYRPGSDNSTLESTLTRLLR